MPALPFSPAGRWPRFVRVAALCLLAGLWAAPAALAQELEDDDNGVGYEREFNYGINFNTNGGLIGGVAFKYAWERKAGWYNRVYLEIVNLKHPKEYKARGYVSNFIPYKTQYLFGFRPSFGQEFVLFSKAPEEGVQLNAVFGAGPTLGITKPYYVLYNQNPNELNPYSVRFDPNGTPVGGVVGVGGVLDGIHQLNIVPGVHARAGLAFESGRVRSSVFGIEAGAVVEAYAKPVELLNDGRGAGEGGYSRPQGFAGLYVVLYYGTKH